MSKGLRTLSQAVALFRDLDPNVPAATVLAFLHIAAAEGGDMRMRDLQDALGVASSSASRNVAFLSERHSLGKAGLDLVENYVDLLDPRYKRVRLKPKGRTLKARLDQLMER